MTHYLCALWGLQEPILYVSDPKALHNILIKEEAIFQETPEFIQYVQHHGCICHC